MSEQDNEVVEATISDEEQELELNLEDDESDDVESLKQAVESERIAKQQILARAKKAEAELKALKSSDKPADASHSSSQIEEMVAMNILKDKGMSDDLIAKLKKFAAVNGTGIIEAQSDPDYIAYRDRVEREQKEAATRLPSSKGSSRVRESKDFNSPGLSDEDHKRLWREKSGL